MEQKEKVLTDSGNNPVWLKFLPRHIQARIEASETVKRSITNVSWLFFEKLLRLFVGLFVFVWLARYLGPTQFGVLNYAIAFVALLSAFSNLGLDAVVVKGFVERRTSRGVLFGTATTLRFLGGTVAMLGAIGLIGVVQSDNAQIRMFVAILSFGLVLKSTETIKNWFESEVMSKYVVWVENAAFLAGSLARVLMIWSEQPLMMFVWVLLAENLLIALGLFLAYLLRGGLPEKWMINLSLAKTLLRESWPLALTNFTAMIYMRIDQIMLGHMMGNESVGTYSAAVRVSELWYFVPIAIVSTLFPSILRIKQENETLYRQRLQQLYDLVVLLALVFALVISGVAGWLIEVLFESAYAEAGGLLAIHVWAGVFVAMGVARSNWLVAENYQLYGFYCTLAGAVINIIGNYFLIPLMGGYGAAVATLLSMVCIILIVPLFIPEIRESTYMLVRAMNPVRGATGLRAIFSR